MQDFEDDLAGDWHATVTRSALDSRVWAPVLPNTDVEQVTNASTSVRRVKAYAKHKAQGYVGHDVTLVWIRTDEDTWTLYDRRDLPDERPART